MLPVRSPRVATCGASHDHNPAWSSPPDGLLRYESVYPGSDMLHPRSDDQRRFISKLPAARNVSGRYPAGPGRLCDTRGGRMPRFSSEEDSSGSPSPRSFLRISFSSMTYRQRQYVPVCSRRACSPPKSDAAPLRTLPFCNPLYAALYYGRTGAHPAITPVRERRPGSPPLVRSGPSPCVQMPAAEVVEIAGRIRLVAKAFSF
jgi:hypothetical protein